MQQTKKTKGLELQHWFSRVFVWRKVISAFFGTPLNRQATPPVLWCFKTGLSPASSFHQFFCRLAEGGQFTL